MDSDMKAYYLLTELFAVSVPKMLSELLGKAMKEKLKDGYDHTFQWWKSKMASLGRVSLTIPEKVALKNKDPAEWEMNLLLKVVKYCNYEPLKRYSAVWYALDDLIVTRGKVFDRARSKKVPEEKKNEYVECVTSALSKFDLEVELKLSMEIDELMSKEPSEEEGEKFHEALTKQRDGWKEFESKLYEKGKEPTLPQLKEFNSKRGKIKIIEVMSTKFIFWGPVLLDDPNGVLVKGIWKEKLANGVEASAEVLRQWLNGEGCEVTWEKLIEALRHADLNAIATKIEESLI